MRPKRELEKNGRQGMRKRRDKNSGMVKKRVEEYFEFCSQER